MSEAKSGEGSSPQDSVKRSVAAGMADPLLQNLDLSSIQDERARECIRRLLSLVETLLEEVRGLRAENQRLRDEVNRLKGEQGKPDVKANRPGKAGSRPHSSEQERRLPQAWHKRSKVKQIRIDRQEKLDLDRKTLPPDVQFKGYETVLVQDLRISTDNVEFLKAKYYSAQANKTYLAPVPQGWEGGFGPGIKALAITFAYGCNLPQPKIAEWFANMGVCISAGEISNLLVARQEGFHAEKEAVYEAGLRSSPWQHLDETGTRVNGQNQHCHVLCNPLYSAYFTTPKNDRLTVVQVLRNLREPVYRLNAEARRFLEQCGFRARAMERLQLLPQGVDVQEAEWQRLVAQHVPGLPARQQRYLWEAAAAAAYHAEVGFPVVRLLVSDDAPQFKLVTEELALCWVHAGRHFKKLEPHFAHHRKLVESFLEPFWGYYRQLLGYRQQPSSGEAERLSGEFDHLFSRVTGYAALDERIAQTRAKKVHLLMVLRHPEIPLHNNPAELGARLRVRKRDASFGPRTVRGAKAWDTFQTLLGTAKKLGVNFYVYIRERIRGAPPTLPGLIALKAQQFPLGASWDTS